MEVELKQTSEWSKLEENTPISKSNIWDETSRDSEDSVTETPRKRNRWDLIPQVSTKKSRWDETPTHPEAQIRATPAGNLELVTPTPGQLMPMTPEVQLWEKDLDARNKPLSDEELNAMFPSTEIPDVGNLPFFKQEDKQHFGKLLEDKGESELPEGMQDYEITS
nr:249_t:CDS:2 [Entrophospora candida]